MGICTRPFTLRSSWLCHNVQHGKRASRSRPRPLRRACHGGDDRPRLRTMQARFAGRPPQAASARGGDARPARRFGHRDLAGSERDRWRRFASYSDFLMANPGWPDEAKLRGYAEKGVDPNIEPERDRGLLREISRPHGARQSRPMRWRSPSLAPHGRERAPLARDGVGQRAAALPDRAVLLGQFGSSLTPDDHLRACRRRALGARALCRRARTLGFVPG